MYSKKYIYPILILIATLTCTIWFHTNMLIGTGESALPFYNLAHQEYLTAHTWSSITIGTPSFITIAYHPYYKILNQLNKHIKNPVLMQSTIFFIALSMMLCGSYLLINYHLKDGQVAGIGALFYTYNPITLVNVWNRLQYPMIFFYALMPIALYVFSRGVNEKKWRYLIVLNILTVIFTTALSALPMLLLFWAVLISYAIFHSVTKRTSLLFVSAFTALAILMWIGTNLWWFLPLLKTTVSSEFITKEAYDPDGNIKTFISLSNSLGNLSYVVRLLHRDFFINMESVWGKWYTHVLMIIITFLPPLLMLKACSNQHKNPSIHYFILLSLLAIFFAKGSQPPFGEIFTYLFSNIRPLEAFRNPFEKIGLIIPLGYAPLIGYALKDMRYKYLITGILIIILPFPMWNGWVFTSYIPPANNTKIGYSVKVPEYYKSANEIINNEKKSESRIIALPIKEEGITYTWEYGYSGVDLYNELFDKPAISLSTRIEYLPQIASQLETLFFKYPQEFIRAMQILNASHLIIREDINYEYRQMTPPQYFYFIEQEPIQGPPTKVGKLTIYTMPQELFQPKIYAVQNIIQHPDHEKNIFTKVLPFVNFTENDAFANVSAAKMLPQSLIKQEIFTPTQINSKEKLTQDDTVYLELKPETVNAENAVLELPHVRVLPDNPLYFLIQIKEQMRFKQKQWSDEQFYKLRLAGKRLVEINSLYNKKKDKKVILQTSKEYKKLLESIEPDYIYRFHGVSTELLRHKTVIDELQNQKYNIQENPYLMEAYAKLNTYFTKGIPITQNSKIAINKQIFEIKIPKEDIYNVIIKSTQENEIFEFNNQKYHIKNNTFNEKIKISAGTYTIHFPQDKQKILKHKTPPERSIVIIKEHTNAKSTSKPPKVTFTKKNNVEYSAHIEHVTQPFILVFSEAYHPMWRAMINNQIQQHVLVNGYANGYYIQKTGTYDVKIEFTGENFLRQGRKISMVTILITGIVTLLYYVKKHTTNAKEKMIEISQKIK